MISENNDSGKGSLNSRFGFIRHNAGLRIAITFNQTREAKENEPEDLYAEFDDMSVPAAIKNAIEQQGYKAEIVEADESAFEKLKKGKYDFVFNIAEGLRGESRESHIPSMLEMLGIPYSGSSVLTQAITLDKRRAKEILLHHKIATPDYQLFNSPSDKINPSLKYPLIVKPNSEGSSKGIRDNSLVNNDAELRERIGFVIKNYKQSALAEEYLAGREFTVSLLGNSGSIFRMPIVEIFVDKYPGSKGIYTYNHKYVCENDSFSGIADIDAGLKGKIYKRAIASFNLLECKDMARVDIRCDKNGEPYVIEVNPLPGMHPDPEHVSYFTKACRLGGLDYPDMINSILYFSFERYGMLEKMSRELRDKILKKLEKIDGECN